LLTIKYKHNSVLAAPSKWVVLSGDERRVLYLICGDYPDGTSAVGEIGILSRETGLSDEDAAGYHQILATYGLNYELDIISQNDCHSPKIN
jgi:hypothetical protein